jgi:hypothetical protein
VDAEKRRVAAIAEAEAQEAKRREADKTHKRRINQEALAAITAAGVDEDVAILVIKMIAKQQVPHVSISY